MPEQVSKLGIIALTPAHFPGTALDPSIAVAAQRAGGIGILDLEYAGDLQGSSDRLAELTGGAADLGGIKCGIDQLDSLRPALAALANSHREQAPIVLLTPGPNHL